jgi:hypothetical protein
MGSPTRHRRPMMAALLVALAATACAGGGPAASPGPPAPAPRALGVAERQPAARPATIDDSTPEGAVGGFVAAEAAEAYDLSYGLLAAADQDRAGSAEDWRDGHATSWPVAGGEVTGTEVDGDKATVTARLRFHSGLDETLGLVPARGEARWALAREGDRWRIAVRDLRIEPVFPDDGDASPRVRQWAEARRACPSGPVTDDAGHALEYTGGLIGFPVLADRLCGLTGPIEVGPVAELEGGADTDRLISAFGPEALTWARVVPLTAPAGGPRAVVGPIGDQWTVVGVLDPAPR